MLRDALLVSELSSLIQFLAEPGAAAVRPVVYYRYFTDAFHHGLTHGQVYTTGDQTAVRSERPPAKVPFLA